MSEIKDISKCINNIFLELTNIKNSKCQELGKLLFYNDEEPLEHEDLLNLTNLIMNNGHLKNSNFTDLIREKKILPFPFCTDTLIEPTSLLSIYYFAGKGRSFVLNDGIICINIFCHQYLWKLNQGIRPLEIIDRVISILNCNKNIGGINNLGLQLEDIILKRDNKSYYGYQVFFRITNFNEGNF